MTSSDPTTPRDPRRPELDCADVAARLSALIDDEISPENRLIAERHLVQCADCRRLVDEAEAVDMMIRVETYGALDGVADDLPPGFEDAVLAATVGPTVGAPGPWRFAAFTGWVAAAAALGFAAFIWTSNQTTTNQPGVVSNLTVTDDDARFAEAGADVAAPMGPALGVDRPGSGATQLAGFTAPGGAHMSNAALDAMPPIAAPSLDESAALMGPFEWGFTLTDDEADAIEQAARLMERLSNASTSTFADVEFIRRAADASNLIERLNGVAERAPEAEQGVLRSVEAALLRIRFGPIGQADIAELRDYADHRDLSDRLAAFSDAFAVRRSF